MIEFIATLLAVPAAAFTIALALLGNGWWPVTLIVAVACTVVLADATGRPSD